MFKVYASKATMKDILLFESDSYNDVIEVANKIFETFKIILKSGHMRPYVCIKIKHSDLTLQQYGAI